MIKPVAALAATLLLASCTTLGVISRLWPFGDDDGGPTAAADGRVAILSFEDVLNPDDALATVKPTISPQKPLLDWPQPGANAANDPGHMPFSGALETVWRRKTVRGTTKDGFFGPDVRIRFDRLTAQPVVANGVIYALGADESVVAIDAADGRRLWSTRLKSGAKQDKEAIGGGVTYDNGKVFVGTGFGYVAALDARNGAELWREDTAAPVRGAPKIHNGRVFVITTESELFSIDAATGETFWSHQAITETAQILTAPAIAATEDIVVAPFASGQVQAILISNARPLWTDALSSRGRLTPLSSINDIPGLPVLEGGRVFAISHAGVLAAIDQRTGRRLWARAVSSIQTPVVSGDAVFVVTTDAQVVAFNKVDGRVFWVRQLQRYRDEKDKKGRIAWEGPLLAGGKLWVVSSQGEVLGVDAGDGSLSARRDLKRAIFIPPIMFDGKMLLLANDGEMIVLQ